tara:strand:- start:2553 stop:2789 length:237 start_codon:yes stop_codon:yes gene_type:complete
MKINVEVEIDPDSYALEYSLSPDEVKGDAQAHLKDLLEGKLVQLGYASKELMGEQGKLEREMSVDRTNQMERVFEGSL